MVGKWMRESGNECGQFYHKNKNPALKPYTVVATKGVPLNQIPEGKFNLHLTMHSLTVASIVKRKINSSVQGGCKQCSLHKHYYLSLI